MSKQLTTNQQFLVDAVADLVNATLNYWPARSGKTTVREAIAARVMEDDENE